MMFMVYATQLLGKGIVGLNCSRQNHKGKIIHNIK
jgi:hypothetical protein